MDKPGELEKKYNVIALEYSKVRSQATVLKKAVLDEQGKNAELREIVKDLQQRIRKHDQEMDSLTFRNEQLTKRISVLQQELQVNSHGKKSKHKQVDNSARTVDFSILDEELHKKILQNAELVSTMADKDLEIANCREKIECLEHKIIQLDKQLQGKDEQHKKELAKEKKKGVVKEEPSKAKSEQGQGDNMCNYWQQEAERWKTECELLRAKPEASEQLTEYFESQVRDLLESKQVALSETNSLLAENASLTARVEQLILEKTQLENNILTNVEELHTTSDNYKSQLEAMTEHLTAQNEKITKQCDEIQVLKHKLSLRK